jgi:hypothetical protein
VRLLVINPAFSQRSSVRLDTLSLFAAYAAENTPELRGRHFKREWGGQAKASMEIRYHTIDRSVKFLAVIQR